jgi:hypothetical protein
MLAIITKASSDYWYSFKEVKTVEDILKIYEKVVIQKNPFKKNDKYWDIKYWEGFKKEDIPKLKKAEINIIIYDDYIE